MYINNSSNGADNDKTYLELEGKLYGAKPNELGAIGGGTSYKAVVKKGDYVVRSLDELIEALSKAQGGEVVFVPGDAVIDMTTSIYIEELVLNIPAGITLASDRGVKGSQGGLICSDALKTPMMLKIMGAGVRITGLRLQGPNPKRYMEHHAKSFGPGGKRHEYYYKFPVSSGINCEYDELEIDNCDISGFSRAGVYLYSGKGHHIHHNFIHHCQYNGLGYGVSHNTAESLIEYNNFDYNRHSIAGTGKPGCSYVARHNVELGESLSHCFDMHGGRDRKDGTAIAGTNIEIYNNTFRSPNFAIGIRGDAEEQCLIYRNWFVEHSDVDVAVRPYGFKMTKAYDNAYGQAPVKSN
ncbi:hypothetical protein GCM10025777_02220 [Membranihabitans marinus]